MSQVVDRIPKEELPVDEQRELKSKTDNVNFVQLYRYNMPAIRKLIKNEPTAADILMFLMQHMTSDNAVCCSQRLLQEVTGKGRTTIYKAIKLLKEEGFMCVFKTGTSNIYVLNPHIAWTKGNEQKQYCKFDGPILLSYSENKDFEKQLEKVRTKNLLMKHD